MDGKPFGVRTHVYGSKDEGKKTLAMVHGYLGNSVGWLHMIRPLAERYRLVLFDHGSWGLNTRLAQCSGLLSEEAAEQWMIQWLSKVFDALDLPEKFYLAGHSIGGWLAAQYASHSPDRIEGLFLMSPAGTEPFKEATWDPYAMKDPDDLRKECMDRPRVSKILRMLETKTHPLADIHQVPRCALRKPLKKWTDGCFRDDLYSEEVKSAAFDYFFRMIEKPSVVDIVELMPFKFECYSLHPL